MLLFKELLRILHKVLHREDAAGLLRKQWGCWMGGEENTIGLEEEE
jgi:hypothetical protein